jgi:hypothetical protein
MYFNWGTRLVYSTPVLYRRAGTHLAKLVADATSNKIMSEYYCIGGIVKGGSVFRLRDIYVFRYFASVGSFYR